MRSPVAFDVDMITISIDGIRIEQCPRSGGHWLDRGELTTLANRSEAIESALRFVSREPQHAARYCPLDSQVLEEHEFADYPGLCIDLCPQCGGIWLDAYELSQALSVLGRESESLEPEAAPAQHPLVGFLAHLAGRHNS